jgi:hypothetical protein
MLLMQGHRWCAEVSNGGEIKITFSSTSHNRDWAWLGGSKFDWLRHGDTPLESCLCEEKLVL